MPLLFSIDWSPGMKNVMQEAERSVDEWRDRGELICAAKFTEHNLRKWLRT